MQLMLTSRLAAVMLIGLLLFPGACAAKTPTNAQIKIVMSEEEEDWRPSTVLISTRGTVTWTNSSFNPHYVISGEGLFNQKLSPGESFKYTFTKPGAFTYHDDPYTAVGTIHVQD